MKYFVIAGEPSGDLHAGNLLKAIRTLDPEACFVGLGGDLMQQQGCRLVQHYRDMAYMGFAEVITHLGSILGIMGKARNAIKQEKPDVVILVDYPSFNLQVAEFVKKSLKNIPVFYYIAPKVWAWKSWRVRSIRRYVDKVFSILPFEVGWFLDHNCPVEYVGNPCVDAVLAMPFKGEDRAAFASRNNLDALRPILAILPGSRTRELAHNLPQMLQAAARFPGYQVVVAGAPNISPDFYDKLVSPTADAGAKVAVVFGQTYQLLQQAHMAVVTSGTATLETALLRTPQVVVYQIDGGAVGHWILSKIIKVKVFSLVNLIAERILVPELVCEEVTADNIASELAKIEPDGEPRRQMLKGYDDLRKLLGSEPVSSRAAEKMLNWLKNKTLDN